MRIFELRVYTLRTKEALDHYSQVIYPRHLASFPLFGIAAHGMWTVKEDKASRLFVLASYEASEDPIDVARRYMQSKEFAHDVRGFDAANNIVSVESTFLEPSAGSPLT